MSASDRSSRKMLTVAEILEDLGGPDGPLSRRTWQEWRAKGTAPKCIKLPNGELRVRRSVYERWLESLGGDAA
jgi:hypothetical protein